ncbi:MAG: LPS export ABC transporter periplasmic protein LptC [Bacteroidales bacterium]|nr:LPS export ABC transporter periplasmic protein LptC [Bacteroidales bacterium]
MRITTLAAVSLFFFSCSEQLEKVHSIASEVSYPTLIGKDVYVIFSDSAKKQISVQAKVLNKYTLGEEPYYEFKEGIYVQFFDSTENVESTISANYAKFLEEKNMWIARDNVVAKNMLKGDQLKTEELFWNSEEKRIYSDKFTEITTIDGTFIGENGFESNQNLTKWKLIGSKGTVNVKDEP